MDLRSRRRLGVHKVSAFTAGPNFPSVGANDATVGGSAAWSNPGNITAQDGTVASNSQTPSNYIKGTGFGFAIPGGATINGILLEVRVNGNAAGHDSSVKLVKGGTISGSDRTSGQAIPSSLTYLSYGGSSDLWGLTLTPADINSATFGAVWAYAFAGGIQNCDAMRITVYYTN